ncbi:MAG: UvrD-helicase domain-containing protein [Lachnospiraceae bacterium]|nr:UvrD-helicase domain-containing protein [Lachnospiraceae bacterium]
MGLNVLSTDREHEEHYLDMVLKTVDENCLNLKHEIQNRARAIEALNAQYSDGDLETRDQINSEIHLLNLAQRELGKNSRAKKKPYFGRILFNDESLYIGRGGVRKGITDVLVADWRAPISNAYYENGLGEVTFNTPDGEKISIDVKLKRTFDINDGKLVDYYDSEAALDDELLNKYLAKTKQTVLNEIIATIQKEQNEIIRLSPRHNLIVQGVAGSGKTTVAMHRISYLLYNYPDILNPKDFYIIGSNKMLLKYITGVLPELDVDGFGQMTMEELFTRLIYEDWDSYRYDIRETDNSDPKACLKGTSGFFEKLKDFCDRYEDKTILQDDVMLDPNRFCEGIEDGVIGIFDRSGSAMAKKGNPVCLLRGSAIKVYIKSNTGKSMQSKINSLNQEIKDNLESVLSMGGVSFTEKEKKAIRKAYDQYLGKAVFKNSIYDIYDEFISEQEEAASMRPSERYDLRQVTGQGKGVEKTAKVKIREFDVYDLAALAYIYHRLKEDEVISEAKHIVIDEAQDYGMMAYRVLNECIHDCKYTIMGDVSQNIRYDSGLNDWQELRELFLPDEYDCFMLLKKSYRNTIEISDFALKILEHGSFEIYPFEPIIRHGDEPKIIKTKKGEAADRIIELCDLLKQRGLMSIAVVCRNNDAALALASYIGKKTEIIDVNDENAEYGQGIMVLPVNMTKGLEFDAVIIYDPSEKDYPDDNRHVKLLYVAATRALHELYIVHEKALSKLFDPLKEKSKVRFFSEDEGKKFIGYEERQLLEEQRRKFIEAEKEKSKEKTLLEAEARTRKYLENRTGASKIETDHGKASVKKKNEEEKNSGEKKFLETVSTELLKPSGHSIGSFATKWIRKQNDGIYFQSQNGILRVVPISKNIVRISFSRGPVLNIPKNPSIRNFGMTKEFNYRETPQAVEIGLKGMSMSIDKYRSTISFKDLSKKEILKDSTNEPKYIDDKRDPGVAYSFFEGKNSDVFYVLSSDGKLNYLNNKALWISEENSIIPCVIKKEKYAIIPLTCSKAAFCRMPVIGTFLMTEDSFVDYYLVVDGNTDNLIGAYKKLTT